MFSGFGPVLILWIIVQEGNNEKIDLKEKTKLENDSEDRDRG